MAAHALCGVLGKTKSELGCFGVCLNKAVTVESIGIPLQDATSGVRHAGGPELWGIYGVIARKTAERGLEPPWTAGTAILTAVERDLD